MMYSFQGKNLVFGVYPMALALMKWPQMWSVMFYLMLLSLGINTNLVDVVTIVTCIRDVYPRLRNYKGYLGCFVCLVLFISGIPMTFDGGLKIFNIFDTYSSGWNSLLIVLFEFIAIAHVYGGSRFLNDIGCMIGKDCALFCIPWRLWKWYFIACWYVVSPICAFTLMVTSLLDWEPADSTLSLDLLAWGLTLTSVGSIFGYMIYAMVTTPVNLQDHEQELSSKGFRKLRVCLIVFREKYKKLTTPLAEWGPHNKSERMLVAEHTKGYLVSLSDDSIADKVTEPVKQETELSSVTFEKEDRRQNTTSTKSVGTTKSLKSEGTYPSQQAPSENLVSNTSIW